MSCWKLRVHGCCFVAKFFPLSCRQTSAEWNPLCSETIHSKCRHLLEMWHWIYLFKNTKKTLEIILLDIITTHLYRAGFPLVCTSAINQTLKIPVNWAVFKEKLLSSQWHSSISPTQLLWVLPVGKGTRQQVADQLLAHTRSPSTSCWGWPGSTLEDLCGVNRQAALPQEGHKPQRGWQGFKNYLSALQNHQTNHILYIAHITWPHKLSTGAQKIWCLCRCCWPQGLCQLAQRFCCGMT